MINTFDLVMIPRITKMCIQQSHSLTKTLANNMNIQLILTIPMVFGLIAIMPSFIYGSLVRNSHQLSH